MEAITLLDKSVPINLINKCLPLDNYYQISLQENLLGRLHYMIYKDYINYKLGIISNRPNYGIDIGGYSVNNDSKNATTGYYTNKIFYVCLLYDEKELNTTHTHTHSTSSIFY